MSRNYYAEINLHITWHTKESAPLLIPKVEAIVHHYLRGRCIATPGVSCRTAVSMPSRSALNGSSPPSSRSYWR